jgi:hypothetical protein
MEREHQNVDEDMPWRSPLPEEHSESSSAVAGSPMPATPIHNSGEDADHVDHNGAFGEGEVSSPAWSSMPQSPQAYAPYPRVLVLPDPPRYDIAAEEGRHALRSHLAQYGYAIVASCASHDEVDTLLSELWDFLEETVPGTAVRRNEPSTWRAPNWLPDPMSGIVSGHGIGQAACMWRARTLPRVRAAFATIWGTDDLLSSFDGANVFRPWHERPEWRTAGGWYHVSARNVPALPHPHSHTMPRFALC